MTKTRSSSYQSSTDFPYQEFLESTSSYDTVGLVKPLINWDKPTPIWKLLKQCGKTADRAEKFLNKVNSAQASSSNRAKLVPAKATIRRELCTFDEIVEHTKKAPSTISSYLKRLKAAAIISVQYGHGQYQQLYKLTNRDIVAEILYKYKESFVDKVVNNYTEMVEEF